MMQDWQPGYTSDELEFAQERFGIRFPADLIAQLLIARIPGGYDWCGDEGTILDALAWPFEGLLFDVEKNDLWWPEWGGRPSEAAERAEILRRVVDSAPRLIPLYSHRYIPESPGKAGNPVFSVYQSDVIYYGRDLAEYLRNEFGRPHEVTKESKPIRYIPFWSDLVERNY
jgi:hypothetical protein